MKQNQHILEAWSVTSVAIVATILMAVGRIPDTTELLLRAGNALCALVGC